eukprot:439044-Rhodomonas_salina.1
MLMLVPKRGMVVVWHWDDDAGCDGGARERRGSHAQHQVQELEISAEKARQSSWNKRDLWSSADDDDERSTRRADRPSIAAADFSSPPIAPG